MFGLPQGDTTTVAWQAASALETLVAVHALQPATALAGLAAQQPSMAALAVALPTLLPRLIPQVGVGWVRQ